MRDRFSTPTNRRGRSRVAQSVRFALVTLATVLGVLFASVRTGPIAALESVLVHARALGESTVSRANGPDVVLDRNTHPHDARALGRAAAVSKAKRTTGSGDVGAPSLLASVRTSARDVLGAVAAIAGPRTTPWAPTAGRARALLMVFLN